MRALVIDDSALQRRFITWLLREVRDLVVAEAVDGAKALQMLKAERYDLVLMEMKLPEMDGLTLLSRLRSDAGPSQRAHVVVVSTSNDEAMIQRAKGIGIKEYLTKPVPAVRIRELVRECLSMPLHDTPAPPGSEKRKSVRMQLAVTVRFASDPPQELVTGDISPFGAFIVCDDAKPVGTEGRLELLLPHVLEPIEIGCRVVHIRSVAAPDMPKGYGVRFISDNPVDMARLVKAFASPDEPKQG
jgi:two-component system chemotaxis response regulator CheY